MGERIERSLAGRVAISVAIVLLLLAQVVTHLPASSALHDKLGESEVKIFVKQ